MEHDLSITDAVRVRSIRVTRAWLHQIHGFHWFHQFPEPSGHTASGDCFFFRREPGTGAFGGKEKSSSLPDLQSTKLL